MKEANDQMDGKSNAPRVVQSPELPLRTPLVSEEAGYIGRSAQDVLQGIANDPGFQAWVCDATGLIDVGMRQLIANSVTSVEESLVKARLYDFKTLQRLLHYQVRWNHANLLAETGNWDGFFIAPVFLRLASQIFRPRISVGDSIYQDARYQEAMTRMWRRLQRKSSKFGPVQNPANYFYRLLQKYAKRGDIHRQGNLTPNDELSHDLDAMDVDQSDRDEMGRCNEMSDFALSSGSLQEEHVRAMRLYTVYREAVEELPHHQKAAFLGRMVGNSARMLARQLGVTENTVHSAHHAAKKNVLRFMVSKLGATPLFDLLPDTLRTSSCWEKLVQLEQCSQKRTKKK